MSICLKSFDDKIADLMQRKKDLATRQAQHLLKYLSTEIGDVFTPQLAACIIQGSWRNAPQNQKEKWLKASANFQFTKPRKTPKKDPQDPAVSPSMGKEKAQVHGAK